MDAIYRLWPWRSCLIRDELALTGLWRMIGSYEYRPIVNVLAMSGQTHERKNVTEMIQIYSDFVLN